MNRTLILAVFSAVPLFAFSKVGADKYSAYAESRRYCVSRVVEGENVITTWFRNGKPDWILPSVETNRIRSITGAVQNNPLQNEIAGLNEELKKLDEALKAEVVKYVTASNRADVAEKRIASAKAGLEAERATWQAKYDKASALLKPVYKLGLDLIDGIIAKLNALKGEL